MISDGNILRFLYFLFFIFFLLRGIKETYNCTLIQKGPKAPLKGIFHSSPVLTAGRVKNRYRCAWLVYPLLLLSVNQAEDEVLFLF